MLAVAVNLWTVKITGYVHGCSFPNYRSLSVKTFSQILGTLCWVLCISKSHIIHMICDYVLGTLSWHVGPKLPTIGLFALVWSLKCCVHLFCSAFCNKICFISLKFFNHWIMNFYSQTYDLFSPKNKHHHKMTRLKKNKAVLSKIICLCCAFAKSNPRFTLVRLRSLCHMGWLSHDCKLVYIVCLAFPVRPPSPLAFGWVICLANPMSSSLPCFSSLVGICARGCCVNASPYPQW